jgi:hypothetical protein
MELGRLVNTSTIRYPNTKVNQVRNLPLMLAVLIATASVRAEEAAYFEIQVVDKQTGRGVPLVE